MNGRHSFDRNRTQKPMNINIYYNINSKNITNNHQVMSHPVSARIPKPSLEDQPTLKQENKSRIKTATKLKKKKYSMDLGFMPEKKAEKIHKKSNNNSICSGNPLSKKTTTSKPVVEKKHNKDIADKKQKKLAALLQNFSGGEIDKQKLRKQILNIFDETTKPKEDEKKHKKRQSQSTLLYASTPRNNPLMRLNSATAHNIKQMQNLITRKKQSKSERCSYSNSKTILSKDKIVQKFVEVKGIDSSLFLGDKEEQKTGVIEFTNEVYTSSSVMLLKQHIERERKHFIVPELTPYLTIQERMAIKIQRAWRKYKTNKLIKTIFTQSAPKKLQQLNESSVIEQIVFVTTQNGLDGQNFLSQQLGNKRTMGQSERVKGETLRKHELQKWNQIIGYVQMNMNNKQLTSQQCLSRIIEYFENVKQTVENQLFVDKWRDKTRNRSDCGQVQKEQVEKISDLKKMKKSVSKDEREITEFTNNALSKEVKRDIEERSDFKEIRDNSGWGEKEEEVESNGSNSMLEISDLHSQTSSQSPFSPNIVVNKKMDAEHHFELNKILNNSHYMNFETMNQALHNYSKKLQSQHQEELQQLNIHGLNYLQKKKIIDQKYNESKKQLRRIIRNLNKGYEDAKNILQKQIVMVSQQGTIYNSKSSLSKCKSDNYLLKTAINYKKFIEKKEKSKTKQKGPKVNCFRSCSDESVQDSNVDIDLQVDKFSDLNGGTSLELGQCLNLNEKEEKIQVRGSMEEIDKQFDDGKQLAHDPTCLNLKLDENVIMSAELMQYEEIANKFDDQDSENHLQSHNVQEISLFDNTKLNQLNKKIKYLTNQDKEDIFEFIFIDVTLELITEYEGTPIYDKICKYLHKIKRLENIPKGVKTNIPACKDYLHLLQGFIIEGYLELFCRHIGFAMGPTAVEMLKYMHDQDPSEDGDQDVKVDQESVSLILPVPIFQLLQKKIVPNYPRYYEEESKQNSRVKFLKSVDHIHHKALFDSLNEFLDNERPFGIWGKPFPWRTSNKRKDDHQNWTNTHKIMKLSKGIEKVVESCSYLCGILVDKQQSLFANHKVSQHYVEQIRENRMSKMLQNDLHQNEERWQFYDDEQTEVLIEITKYVSEILFFEAAVQFYSLNHEMDTTRTRELVETFSLME